MGLFDKKYCDICGEKIAFLGARKLSDGQLCKNCASQLSPWFSERKSSSVDDIRLQLGYRKNNAARVEQFNISESYGDSSSKLLIDRGMNALMITGSGDWRRTNPDIIDFKDITGCRYEIDDSTTELKKEDKDGKEVSYNPKAYHHNYGFNITIFVSNPYFDEMYFRFNSSSSVVLDDTPMPGDVVKADPLRNAAYKAMEARVKDLCEMIKKLGEDARAAEA